MEHSDILLTLAEVGIAFAGFAGLAGVFGRARVGVDPQIHYHRIRSMIEVALVLVVFSMAPLVMATSQLDGNAVWRLSSLLLAATGLSVILAAAARMRHFRAAAGFSRVLAIVLLGSGSVVMVVLFANAAGVFPSSAASVYVFCLGWFLIQSSILFLRVLLVFVPRGEDKAP